MSRAKSILITGASSGIGAALALHYAEKGISLALAARRPERLEAIASVCRQKGANCLTQVLDVRDTGALVDWIETVHAENPIDLAIINAGVAATRVDATSGELLTEMRAQIATNMSGTLMAAQTIGALMFARRSGHLVLVSSLNAVFPVVEAPTYSATKAGILAYSDAIRDWLEPRGVHVTAVCPGFVRTGIAERYSGPRPFEISAEKAARRIAAGVDGRRRTISFPLVLVAAIHLGRFVPRFCRRRILAAYTARLAPLATSDTEGL